MGTWQKAFATSHISGLAVKYQARKLFKVPVEKLNEIIIPHKIKYNCKTVSFKKLISKYKPAAIKAWINKEFANRSNKIQFIVKPVQYLSALPFGDAYTEWENSNKPVHILILINGSTTIQHLYRQLHNNSIIEKIKKDFFIIKTPIFISKHAKLLIEKVKVGLAFKPVSPIMCAGKLAIVNSVIETWDIKKRRYLPIGKIPYKFYYLFGTQPPRPYIATIKGGQLVIVSSTIKGLGYRGLYSTYGISVGNWSLFKQFVFFLPDYQWIYKYAHPNASNTHTKDVFSNTSNPSAILVGNNIINNYMGFFSSRAKNVAIIGNIFDGNFQYNIDPHNWTNNITIAFNIIKNSRKAHGIVFSRFVRGKIFNNLSIGNSGAGIMLDRISQACINSNIVIGNKLGGITILESDNSSILNNSIVRNSNYGIYVRNSLNVLIKNNRIFDNGGSGVEAAVVNINYQIYRNLYIDEYHMAASVWQEGNIYKDNFKGCIKDLYAGEAFFKNKFPNFPVFKGTTGKYLKKILLNQDKKPVIIAGRGNKKPIGKKRVDSVPYVIQYLCSPFADKTEFTDSLLTCGEAFLYEGLQAHQAGCRNESIKLIKRGIKNIIEAAMHGNSNAFYVLGLILSRIAQKSDNWLTLISEAAIMGNTKARYLLYLLYTIGGISDKKINSCINVAYNKLMTKNIIDSCTYKILFNLFNINFKSSMTCKINNTCNNINQKETFNYFDAIVKDLEANNYFEETLQNKVELLKKRITEKNKNIKAFFKWENDIEKKYINFISEYPRFMAYANREFHINTLWKQWLKIHNKKDFDSVKPELQSFFEKFNYFREKTKKISVKKSIKLIRRMYFE